MPNSKALTTAAAATTSSASTSTVTDACWPSCRLSHSLEKQTQLWQDLFSHPWDWWDNRLTKKSPAHPDFRHKISRDVLWLNHSCTPSWVGSRLPSLDRENTQNIAFCEEIQALCDCGQLDAALDALCSCAGYGLTHNAHAYVSFLKACSRLNALSHIKQVSDLVSQQNLVPSGLVSDHTVGALAKCGALNEARLLLLSLPHRSVYSWTALISGFVACGHGCEALPLHQQMRDDGFEPDICTYVNLLKACTLSSNLKEAESLHVEVERKGLSSDVFIGSTLISVYGKCRRILEAENIFERLYERNVVSWSAMLSAYVEQGPPENALQLYRQMQEEGVSPNQQSFVMALQACSILLETETLVIEQESPFRVACLNFGQALHADARKKGFGSDVFVGCAVLSHYGRCGSITQVEHVFDELPERDIALWNAMFSACVEQGQGEKVLQLYQQMHVEGIMPNPQTFVIAFQACNSLPIDKRVRTEVMPLTVGKALHVDARRKGFTTNTFVRHSIVSTYGKCGSLVETETIFKELHHHDTVSWNAMLSACVGHSKVEKALQFYKEMQVQGVSPNQQTFVIAFQACGIQAMKDEAMTEEMTLGRASSLDFGRILHSDAENKGLLLDACVRNTVLSMYGKCGSLAEAEHVFVEWTARDEVSWTALLSAYVEQGKCNNAVKLYRQMQEEGIWPIQLELMIVPTLQACSLLVESDEVVIHGTQSSQIMALEIGEGLHADALRKGLTLGGFTGSALVSMYGKCGDILKAEYAFDGLNECDIVSWSVMMSVYVDQGRGENALQLYKQMQVHGICPDQQTVIMALQACCSMVRKDEVVVENLPETHIVPLEIGRALHVDAQRMGFMSDLFVCNAVMTMYGRCGSILEAETVFAGLMNCDVVSRHVMLSAYVEQGEGEKALELFRQMKEEGVPLNDVTITCALEACRTVGNVEMCKQLHFSVIGAGYDMLPAVRRILISTYGFCAHMADARAVFDVLPDQDVMSWTACIIGYTREGNSIAGLRMFEEMQRANIIPDEKTFLALLSACSRSCLVDKGVELFELMSKAYAISPNLKHYATIIDLLGHAGEFKRMESILSEMPMQANWAIWMCVLGACRTFGNVELGKQAFDNAVRLNPKEAATYVMMSSIYMDAGLQHLALEVEILRVKECRLRQFSDSLVECKQGSHLSKEYSGSQSM